MNRNLDWKQIIAKLCPTSNIILLDDTTLDYWADALDSGDICFTPSFFGLSTDEKRFVALRECVFIITSRRYNETFYKMLTPLIEEFGIPFSVARKIEQVYPDSWLID